MKQTPNFRGIGLVRKNFSSIQDHMFHLISSEGIRHKIDRRDGMSNEKIGFFPFAMEPKISSTPIKHRPN